MPRTSDWIIRPAAAADLSNIWFENAAAWGVEQAERHAHSLFAVFDLRTEFPDLAQEHAEFTRSVRIHPSGSQLVIYRPQGQGVEIIRILHARQKLSVFLQDG